MKIMIIIGLCILTWIIIAPWIAQLRISDSSAKKIFHRLGLPLTTLYFENDDRILHYAMIGAENLPTIIFLHGSPGSWNYFIKYLGDLDLMSRYRMIAVDRPGFGYSEYGKARKLEYQSGLISSFIRQLKNDLPLYLVGHSFGAPLAVMLAAENNAFVNGLVILSGSVDPNREPSEKWRKWLDKTPLNYLIPGAFRVSNRELIFFKDEVQQMKSAFNQIQCKVYIMHGDKDKWVSPANVDFAKKELTNASAVNITILPGANHFIPWTRYKKIKELLIDL